MSKRGLLAVALLSCVGCMGQPPVEGQSFDEASSTAFANDQPAYDFFVGKGLTNFQAAGIVGNLDQESGVNPGSVQYGGGPGRGIAQWSVGGRWDTSTNDNVLWYAGVKGESSGSLNLQLEFIWYELTNIGYGYSKLKATTNVTDATVVFMSDYEICGTCDQTQRVAYAQSVLDAYGATPDWKATFVSQSWPYASQPAFQVKCGEAVSADIVLKNTGGKSWNSNTRLGTTMPRDRASIFTGSDWVSSNRAAEISGTVAPGADGKFSFSFHGPTGADCKPGMYQEYFGVVQEGTAWFSDNGQGGPPDDQIEALIELVPGNPASSPDGGSSTGSGGSGGGSATGGSGGNGDTGNPGDPGNPGNPGTTGSTNGAMPAGGCSVAVGAAPGASVGWMMLGLLLVGLVRRRLVIAPAKSSTRG